MTCGKCSANCKFCHDETQCYYCNLISNKSGEDGRSCSVSTGKIFTYIIIPVVGGLGLIVVGILLFRRWRAKKKEEAEKKAQAEDKKNNTVS